MVCRCWSLWCSFTYGPFYYHLIYWPHWFSEHTSCRFYSVHWKDNWRLVGQVQANDLERAFLCTAQNWLWVMGSVVVPFLNVWMDVEGKCRNEKQSWPSFRCISFLPHSSPSWEALKRSLQCLGTLTNGSLLPCPVHYARWGCRTLYRNKVTLRIWTKQAPENGPFREYWHPLQDSDGDSRDKQEKALTCVIFVFWVPIMTRSWR